MAIERLQFLCEKPREQSTEDYQTDQYAKPHLVRLQLVGLHVHPGQSQYVPNFSVPSDTKSSKFGNQLQGFWREGWIDPEKRFDVDIT